MMAVCVGGPLDGKVMELPKGSKVFAHSDWVFAEGEEKRLVRYVYIAHRFLLDAEDLIDVPPGFTLWMLEDAAPLVEFVNFAKRNPNWYKKFFTDWL